MDWTRLFGADQGVLEAALVSRGLAHRQFNQALGWDLGVRRHRYQAGSHLIHAEDSILLDELLNTATDPGFWRDYTRRGLAAGERLIRFAAELAGPAGPAGAAHTCEPDELQEGFRRLAEAAQAAAPFIGTAPGARRRLQHMTEEALARRVNGNDPGAMAAQTLGRYLSGLEESEPAREIRSCYSLALGVAGDPAALELVRELSARRAMEKLESSFPEIHESICRHAAHFAWLGNHHGGDPQRFSRNLLQRLQVIVLRWRARTIAGALDPKRPSQPADSLGLRPDEPAYSLLESLTSVVGQDCFSPRIYRRVLFIARPFLGKVAQAVGGSSHQIRFCSDRELAAALATGVPLPLSEVDRRMDSGFRLERFDDELTVEVLPRSGAGDAAAGGVDAPLVGQSVCLGRAVGRVRIVTDAMGALALELGDILLTSASTPDKMGTESAFPQRSAGPPGMDRAGAIVTEEGGLLSHAAIVSREMGIPCIVGVEGATGRVAEGDIVEVDATRARGVITVW